MGGRNTGNYLTGGLETLGGAAATVFGAPEIGIPLMTGGVGQLAGTGAGGARGGQIGQMAGLAAGGLGEGAAGLAGMGPLANSLSQAPALQQVAQNPAVSPIGAQTVPLPGGGTMQLPPLAGGQQPVLGQGAAALMRQDYPLATRLDAIPQYSGGAGGSSGLMDFLKTPGGAQMASSAMSAMQGPQQPPQPPPSPPQLRPAPPPQQLAAPQPAVANVPKPPGAPSAGGDPTQMLAMLKAMLGGSGGVA